MNIPVGLPYDQADCWDLFRKIYLDHFGFDLGSRWKQVFGIKHGIWLRVLDDFKEYDLLIFRDGPIHKHVGMVIDPSRSRFIHTMESTGAVIGNYRSTQWKDRLQRVYRHRSRILEVA